MRGRAGSQICPMLSAKVFGFDRLHVADEPALVELQVFALDAERSADKTVRAVDADQIAGFQPAGRACAALRAGRQFGGRDFDFDAVERLFERDGLTSHANICLRLARSAVERGFEIGLPLAEVGIIA